MSWKNLLRDKQEAFVKLLAKTTSLTEDKVQICLFDPKLAQKAIYYLPDLIFKDFQTIGFQKMISSPEPIITLELRAFLFIQLYSDLSWKGTDPEIVSYQREQARKLLTGLRYLKRKAAQYLNEMSNDQSQKNKNLLKMFLEGISSLWGSLDPIEQLLSAYLADYEQILAMVIHSFGKAYLGGEKFPDTILKELKIRDEAFFAPLFKATSRELRNTIAHRDYYIDKTNGTFQYRSSLKSKAYKEIPLTDLVEMILHQRESLALLSSQVFLHERTSSPDYVSLIRDLMIQSMLCPLNASLSPRARNTLVLNTYFWFNRSEIEDIPMVLNHLIREFVLLIPHDISKNVIPYLPYYQPPTELPELPPLESETEAEIVALGKEIFTLLSIHT